MKHKEHTQESARRTGFTEPQGWALKWAFTPEMTAPPTDREPRNGYQRRKFAEPQGWALNWDGAALSGAGTERAA